MKLVPFITSTVFACVFPCFAAVNLSGQVLQYDSLPKQGVVVSLSGTTLSDTTNAAGEWSLFDAAIGIVRGTTPTIPVTSHMVLRNGRIQIHFSGRNVYGRKVGVMTNTSATPSAGAGRSSATEGFDTLVYSWNGKTILRDTIAHDSLARKNIARHFDTTVNPKLTYGYVWDSQNHFYRTVKIHTRTWMAENLNYAVDNSWCYENSTSNCNLYGRLYSWAAMMVLDSTYNHKGSGLEPRQGICPKGWHIPSKLEWGSLYPGGVLVLGPYLKSASHWNSGSDDYGFHALPAGTGGGCCFNGRGANTGFWSSTEYVSEEAWYYRLQNIDGRFSSFSGSKLGGMSVRCISDSVYQPLLDTVKRPVFNLPSGSYASSQLVSISTPTDGATIYYTTDGSTPADASASTITSTKYVSPVTVSVTQTLKAIAVKSGMTTSPVDSATYTIASIDYGSLSYGGQTYKTVKIGTQTWMAENLNYAVDSSWCYTDSADSCSKYGRLYQWAAIMGLDPSYNSKLWNGALPHQGICPTGWHVPSKSEWDALINYIGYMTAGKSLQSTTFSGTDLYGFCGLPAGDRDIHGSFFHVGTAARFWSSSEDDQVYAWNKFLENNGILNGMSFQKTNSYSARCLKDAP